MKKLKIISFGFKYGKPFSNFTFDVSFLKNPKFMNKESEDIWHLTPEMRDYVVSQEKAQQFIDLAIPFIKFVGNATDCVIGVGCTGGHHRSVTIAEILAEKLKDDFIIDLIHRDQL